MTRSEYLAEVARIHSEWSQRVMERHAGEPFNTTWRDAAEHEAEVLATPQDDAEYWEAVGALTKRYRAEHPLA